MHLLSTGNSTLLNFQDYVPDRLSELAEALANPIKYQSELDKREHQLAVLTEGTDAPAPVPAQVPRPEGPQGPHTVAHPVS